MKKLIPGIAVILVFLVIIFSFNRTENQAAQRGEIMELPEPQRTGDVSLEETLEDRRSRRQFDDVSLDSEQLSQLLWAGQGISDERRNFRTAPSAGALYPLETFAAISNVDGLEPGLYRYMPEEHALEKIMEGDLSDQLQSDALGQEWVGAAPLNIILTALYERIVPRYGDRAERYTHMEVGHAAQNVYLQAEALGLGTVAIGAFSDEGVSQTLQLEDEEPLMILPVGKPR